jgi:hypothetical protein
MLNISIQSSSTKPTNNTYSINLNSSKANSEDLKKSTAAHDICHAFDLNDREDHSYIMYG